MERQSEVGVAGKLHVIVVLEGPVFRSGKVGGMLCIIPRQYHIEQLLDLS
jgi:hypothetical protein